MSRLKNTVASDSEETKPVFDSDEPKSKAQTSKSILNKFIEEETRLVKGKFRNFENPGCAHTVYIKKYPGIPPFEKSMMDGGTYEIPLYVARHLNGVDVTATKAGKKLNTCSYETHGFQIDGSGNLRQSELGAGGVPIPIIKPSTFTRRVGFDSLDFGSEE